MKLKVRAIRREPVEMLPQVELSRSQERERQVALLLLPHERLVGFLWQRVMIPDALVHIALDMSDACWQKLKTTDNAPPRVMINGLRFVLTSDLRAWLERQEKTMTVKERRGRRK